MVFGLICWFSGHEALLIIAVANPEARWVCFE